MTFVRFFCNLCDWNRLRFRLRQGANNEMLYVLALVIKYPPAEPGALV
jgi:hypothetical protein